MKKQFLVFLFFCQFAFVRAQEEAFAVINDKDGYVNVREGKSAQSKVLKRLNNKTIVFVYNYDKATDGNWIYTDEEGYIYNDRVKWIHKFPIIAKGIAKGNTIVFEGKEIQVILTSGKFDKSKHSFKYFKDSSTGIEVIDDPALLYGNDGKMPTTEYRSIVINIHGKQVSLPKDAYSDLYEPTFLTDHNSVYYDKESDILYIVANNNYADRPYKVCWQIERGVYKGRKVTELVY
ncbi:SH3 domain-containing protein [uncultured Capnocytophaga sp.]|uniref:SH3 domain-containing protein n=1 Tax=uncultured Capnocytophaga sp. TaxID=159273 RepID=UPI00262695E2|nr:SH3 domain-containing protein [uncultured Capnocytophaga sp.]